MAVTTIFNWVVQGRKTNGKEWFPLEFCGGIDEMFGRDAYNRWRNSKGDLRIRLIKRTAVIADEIIETGTQKGSYMDISKVGEAVTEINNWIDGDIPPTYKEQPLAQHWARIAKLQEEAGEVVDAFIRLTGQNPRKGKTENWGEFLDELADVAATAILAIQHFTGDWTETEQILWDKLISLRERVPEEYHLG
jgi:NTP pyrophosphatase (non-canonical NTP hydrolase)